MPEPTQPDLAPLLETVADEARQHRDTQLAEARQSAALRLAEAERKASEIRAQATATGVAEGDREAQSRIARARIATRRDLLRERETHLERAIELATGRLEAELRGAEGAALVAAAVRAAARTLGETRLRIRAAGVDRRAVAAALGAGAPGIEWEDEADADVAGIVASSLDRHRMVDMTLDGIVRRRHDEARRAAAEALLGKRGDP
jgi:vacuolar-type H+-ATPase subunit E/Vma4